MNIFNNSDSFGNHHSSKGNQFKLDIDGYWYKADFLGYEGAAEYFSSVILSMSNIPEYVTYELCDMTYNDIVLHGCKSKDFLKPSQYNEIVTLETLFKKEKEILLENKIRRFSTEDKIKYVVDEVQNITKLDKFGSYLSILLDFDRFILNEDRHFRNIAVLKDKDGNYGYCPVFDNGAAFLSDTKNDYPIEKSVEGLMWNVLAKPFSEKFDKQVEIVNKLYGNAFSIKADKIKIYEALENIENVYGRKIADRIKTIYNKQTYLNMDYRREKPIKTPCR